MASPVKIAILRYPDDVSTFSYKSHVASLMDYKVNVFLAQNNITPAKLISVDFQMITLPRMEGFIYCVMIVYS